MKSRFFAIATFSAVAHTCIALGIAILTTGASQIGKAQTETDVTQNQQFQVMGRPSASQTMKFNIHLRLRNSAKLDQLIADQSNPNSPNYHKFLTPKQFREQFGPSQADINQVTAILNKLGLQVTSRASQSIEAQGTVSAIEQAFGANLMQVRYPNKHTAIKSMRRLKLPASLAQMGAQVIAFDPQIRTRVKHSAKNVSIPQNRTSSTGDYWVTDLKQAYNFPSYQVVTGAGRTIGILIDGDFKDDDINAYFAHENINTPNVVRHPVLGGAAFNDDSFETELDIEQAGGMAPGATIVHYNIPDESDESFLAGYIALVEDNKVDIVNLSFGFCEKKYTAEYNNGVDETGILKAEDDLFRQGNAQGITFVASSGDYGGLGCPTPDYYTTPPTNPPSIVGHFTPGVLFPASSPHVTAVGGTNLVTTFEPPSLKSEYIGENAYYDPLVPYDPNNLGNLVAGGVWGSGGGESILFDKPSFQNLVNTGTQKRAIPDVSLHMGGACGGNAILPCGNGNDRSGDVEVFDGQQVSTAGTSASSPDFAGLLALKEEALGGVRLGNVNYMIYALSAQNDVSKVFRQDIPGNNGVYTTSPGYNLVLGNGTINGNNFVFDGSTNFPSAGDPLTPSNP